MAVSSCRCKVLLAGDHEPKGDQVHTRMVRVASTLLAGVNERLGIGGIFRPLLPSTGATVLFRRMAVPKATRGVVAAAKPAWAGRARRIGMRDSMVARMRLGLSLKMGLV